LQSRFCIAWASRPGPRARSSRPARCGGVAYDRFPRVVREHARGPPTPTAALVTFRMNDEPSVKYTSAYPGQKNSEHCAASLREMHALRNCRPDKHPRLDDAPGEPALIGIMDHYFANQVRRQLHSIRREFRSTETPKTIEGTRVFRTLFIPGKPLTHSGRSRK
jgi:hypothetical protein